MTPANSQDKCPELLDLACKKLEPSVRAAGGCDARTSDARTSGARWGGGSCNCI
jgi:galactokinase